MNLVLNLGCGSNPMSGAINVDVLAEPGVDVVADALNLPFVDQTFAEVHVINPHGFYPVSPETWRVLQENGFLFVTGYPSNPDAAPLDPAISMNFGFDWLQTPPILPVHIFGTSRTTKGRKLKPELCVTTLYRRLP